MTSKLYKGIKPARKLLQLTQGDLSRRMDKNQCHLSSVETGKDNGNISFYEKLCDAMNLPFIVIAMEALQIEDVRSKEMEEFLEIKNQLYRFLGVDKVLKEVNDIMESRKIVDKLCKPKQPEKNLTTQD